MVSKEFRQFSESQGVAILSRSNSRTGVNETSKLLHKLRASCVEHANVRKVSELLDQVLAFLD